ncbi:N-acetylmuramoyl-L-alanine amidase [Ciceribacter sp. L1K22]|nr:N-acetylmuramoyl-L-alanine amidase [Ciceribacter sp. L1K22]
MAVIAVVLGASTGGSFASGASLVATEARIAGDEARTRIVIDFDRSPDFQVHYIADPPRIVVDLPETDFGFAPEQMAARGLFRDIRYGSMGGGTARIVLTAERPVRLATSEVQAQESGEGYRLVLDAEVVSDDAFAEQVKGGWKPEPVSATAERGDRIAPAVDEKPGEFVIAIDAGHGGIDAGASGATTKTPEKEITLAFAKVLADHVNKKPGMRAVLTRTGDEFLSLSSRVAIARQKGADLLISLHADTLRQAAIRGATVYTISDKASDRMAADLAERENLSDAIAGIDLTAEPTEVTDILLDLTRRETQAFSITLANTVVESFKGQVGLINNPHRYAGFRVLQAHDMPSILLELGFLSNKEDEKLLLDEAWREKVAALLAEAVVRYRDPVIANGG